MNKFRFMLSAALPGLAGMQAAAAENMQLPQKSDHELLAELKELAEQEKNIHVRVLGYLREVEKRQLHVARGFSSLFAFCTEYLGFTEAEAHTRIQAMRLSKEIPCITEKIGTGELSLTNIAQAQAIFRRENVDRETKEAVLKSLENKSTRAAERTLAILFPQNPKPEKATPISETNTRIEFTANQRLMDKLETLKNLLAHKNFSGRYDLLFEHLADEALKKLIPQNGTESLGAPKVIPCVKPKAAPKTKKARRRIPAPVRRQMMKNHRRGCNYVDPENGRRCGSKRGLQIDHVLEFSRGGSHDPANLQLLCPAHNQFKSRELTAPFREKG